MKLKKILKLGTLSMVMLSCVAFSQAVRADDANKDSKANVELKPGEDGSGGTDGTIEIVSIDNLDFGENKVDAGASGVGLKTGTTPAVKLKDNRGGDNDGFELKVKLTDGKMMSGTKELKGAKLTLKVAHDTTGYLGTTPTTAQVELNSDLKPIITAAQDQATGTTKYDFTSDTKLVYPDSSLAGVYTGTLNWVLGATPAP